MNSTSALIFSSLLLPLSLPAVAGRNATWESFSDPAIMSYYYNRKFSELPLSGSVKDKKKLWSGDYWALKKGNINYRWYAKTKIGFNLNSPDKMRAMNMTIPELAQLSPSEKYDLFIGRYDYPLRNEVTRIADSGAEIWEGICHGWSPATMNHDEPTPKLMTNPDGIGIPFGSSDIKALISYYYAHGFSIQSTHQMGRRCYRTGFMNTEKDCSDDLNAGAFHLVLANRIGVDGKSFIVDLERYKEVWNHPISSYSSKIIANLGPDSNSAPGTIKTVHLKTILTYVDENGHDWHPVIGTDKQQYKTIEYQYHLDLNEQDMIIGGSWDSRLRPDFLWLAARPRKFEGVLYRLDELLNDD